MQTLKMSRASREVFEFLSSVASQHNIGMEISPSHMYMLDLLTSHYYPKPIIQLIKARLNSIKNIGQKHCSAEYWFPMIVNILRDTMRKSSSPSTKVPDFEVLISYSYIQSDYLLTDYSIDDTDIMMRIVHTYTYDEISFACRAGIASRVYEPRYISAILEKERAKKGVQQTVLNNINTRIDESSNKLSNGNIQDRTVLDMAQVLHNWDKERENNEIMVKFNEMLHDPMRGE